VDAPAETQDGRQHSHFQKKKEGEAMVELDQFKVVLNSYTKPLVEVRDSL